jgi:hypothetical protein
MKAMSSRNPAVNIKAGSVRPATLLGEESKEFSGYFDVTEEVESSVGGDLLVGGQLIDAAVLNLYVACEVLLYVAARPELSAVDGNWMTQ